jgi:hypothetical protein
MEDDLKVDYKRQRYTPKIIKEFNYEQNFKGPTDLSDVVSPQQRVPNRRRN